MSLDTTVGDRSTLIAEIRSLEQVARALDPDHAARAGVAGPVLAYADEFLDRLPGLKAFDSRADRGAGILGTTFREEPTPVKDILALLREHVDRPGINPASGGHFGYIPGGGLYTSALGDYLADVTNRYAGVFFAAPGAVRMENRLLAWMARLVGYPETFAGNLASGGSIANLLAVVAARDAAGIGAADVPRTVAYLSPQAHHCLGRAFEIAGLREIVRRDLPLDSRYRIRPDAAERQIERDVADGLRPWLLVGTAGTTDMGAIDPLDALADIAERHRIWYHVDGAYGAFFALTEEGKRRLKGMERSDSIVMDPHKTLFLPFGLGVVLVRRREHLEDAFRYHAHYMQDAQQARDEISPADVSPELTKPFRGLRLWLPLLVHGVGPFRAALQEKLALARYFHREVAALGFEVGPEPELSVVTYRWIPRTGAGRHPTTDPAEIDRFNERVQLAVQEDGRVFITSTRIEGRVTLRLAVVVHRTHLEQVDLALAVLREKVRELEGDR